MSDNKVIDLVTDQNYFSISCWDNKGELYFGNNKFEELFGLSMSKINIDDFRKHIDNYCFSEDLEKFDQFIGQEESSLLKSELFDLRIKFESKTKWLKISLLRNEEGIKMIASDNTEDKETLHKTLRRESQLKEQNQRLSQNINISEENRDNVTKNFETIVKCLKNTNIFPWEYNVKTSVVKADIPGFDNNSLFGVMTQIRFDQLLEIIKSDDIEKVQFDKAVERINNHETFSVDIRLKNGATNEYQWFEIRASLAQRDIDNKILLVSGVAININDRKIKEINAEKEKTTLLNSDRSKNVYYSNLAHEIRTPLHAIIGFSDIIVNIESKEERLKYADAIRVNNEKLINLIDGVGEINDTYAENKLKEERVSLWEYMVEQQQIYSMKSINGCRILFNNQYDSSVYIFDKEKVSELFDSLIKTTIRLNNCATINFGYELQDSKLKFFIKDNGEGLSQEQLEGIFDRPEKDGEEKDYIGLSYCKSLVYMMNGEIDVISSKGLGTCYTFNIPLKVEQTKEQQVVKQNVKPLPINQIDEKPKLLIAEDVIYSFQMLKTILEDRFDIYHAENGEQAVEIFKKEKPAFIFMDIKMPIMDGIEATKLIREIDSNVPIIVLTAYAVRSLKKQASEAGCTDLLTKPSTSRQINAVIKKHLYQKSKL